MKLTDDERAILEGNHGAGAALAMKVLVGIGEAFDAERLVPITRAHVALSNQEGDLWFAEKLLTGGARCRIPPTVNPGFSLDFFARRPSTSDEGAAMMRRTLQTYRSLGAVLSFSCTPYLYDNIPRQGEIVAFSESSATPFVNAVWGAFSNREAAQSALCAAVVGKVPLYGLLLPPNRRATARVIVEADLSDDFAYQQLGWAVPRKIGHRIPVFEGIPQDVTMEALMNLGAQLNTAGAIAMYHIVGVTPEAPTLSSALQGHRPEVELVLGRKDLEEQVDRFSDDPGPIDFLMFGCPHYTLRQVKEIATLVEGKKLRTEMWVLTSAYTLAMARRMGLTDIIEKAGGYVVADTCIDQPCWLHLQGKRGATDSPKCAYYTRRRGLRLVVRDLQNCVTAGLKGRIE